MPAPNVEAIKDQKDIAGLISALKDDDATVRYQAAQALDELRDLRAFGPALALLASIMPAYSSIPPQKAS